MCRYEAALDPWLANLWSALRHIVPLPFGASEPSESDAMVLDPPKFKVTYVSQPTRNAEKMLADRVSEVSSNGTKTGSGLGAEDFDQLRSGVAENGGSESFETVPMSAAAGAEANGGAVEGLGPLRACLPSANGHQTVRAAERNGNEIGNGNENGNRTVATASASGDELEENLRAIAVLDDATSASSGHGVKAGAGSGPEGRLGYSQANPFLASMVSTFMTHCWSIP